MKEILENQAIMAEINKIKIELGCDAIFAKQSKSSTSVYIYLYKKSEWRISIDSAGEFFLDRKKQITSFFKIRVSDHIGRNGRKENIDIISNGKKAVVFFNKQLWGGEND